MMTTILGFLASVWADATPPNARGSASIVVATRLLLIIDVSFHLPNLQADQRADFLLHPARTGPTTKHCALKKKHPIDQRSSKNHATNKTPTRSNSPKIRSASENS